MSSGFDDKNSIYSNDKQDTPIMYQDVLKEIENYAEDVSNGFDNLSSEDLKFGYALGVSYGMVYREEDEN